MNKHTKPTTYENNPVTLLIESVRRGFNDAQNVAIFLIVIPIGLSMVQLILQTFAQVFAAAFDSNNGQSISSVSLIIGLVLTLLALLLAVFINVSWTGFSASAGLAILNRKNEKFNTLFSAVLEKFMKILAIILLVALYSLPWWIAMVSAITAAVVAGIAGGAIAIILLPLSIIAAAFFILMAVRVNIRYALSNYALFDGKASASEAMKESKELTRGRLIEVFGIMSLGSIVPFLSALLVAGGNALLYDQLKGHRDSKDKLPKPHILNYLVLFLLLGFILFIGLILMAAMYAGANQ